MSIGITKLFWAFTYRSLLDTYTSFGYSLSMDNLTVGMELTEEQARELEVQAAAVFKPRAPINTRELFAGRWSQIKRLADAVGQSGLHIIIYGERGVGKTSLANIVKPLIHVFDDERIPNAQKRLVIKANASSSDSFSSIWNKVLGEITWKDNRPGIGLDPGGKVVSIHEAFDLPSDLTTDDVRRVLARIPGAVFIIDEFDRAAQKSAHEFTDLIKALSDFTIECTVILVGVSDTVDALVADHASITRSLVEIQLPRMEVKELTEILTKSEKSLDIKFSADAANLIVHVSQGLPHYTHLLGLNSVRKSAEVLTKYVDRDAVFKALNEAVTQAQQSVSGKHSKAIHSAHKDALYRHVLLACALAAARSHDALGYFNPGSVVEPLSGVLGRKVAIASFNNHLGEFCQEKRGTVLERDGQARAYRFRFHDPLLVPYIFMDAVSNGLIDDHDLTAMLSERS